jgi:hypothetical protein
MANENPIILAQIMNPFITSKGYEGQSEVKAIMRQGKKINENTKFVDSIFQAMLKTTGWTTGAAWCAYFVKLFLMQFYSFDRDWINKTLSGGAISNLDVISNLNKKGKFTWTADRSNNPQIGDVIVWRTSPTKGHTGIVTNVDATTVTTIEGNTTARSTDREGDLVKIKKYPKDSLKIGQTYRTFTLLGYFRRVFTPEEISKLYYDEAEQTLKFRK